MKIFNWVHKKFHHNNSTLKDGFASNMKKTESTLNNSDNQALLKQVALTNMLGGWNDGILTIGTLGYDPLESINHHKDYFGLEAEKQHDLVDDVEKFYNVEKEELNPLIKNTFGENNFEDVVCENHDDIDAIIEDEMMIRNFKEIVEVPHVICHEIMEANDVESDQKKRITLADLFLADSDVKMKLDYHAAKVMVEANEKPNLKAKNGLSFAKKIIPKARPMKDIKKLMKKMLKRKIHPDFVDVKNHKAEGIINDNHMNEGNESSHFLPI
ncbi:hypothetical protein P8452_74088 [Trifolium repens]|nr:NAD-dependent protein deacetylase HST1 protein [Trifolium repens]WJX92447.1 hypothetical protein P8452_74088 [Trifolium repens]